MHYPNDSIRRTKIGWFLLIGLTVIFMFLYLKSALIPGPIDPAITKYFSFAMADKARIYNSTPRILFIVKFVLQIFLLFWLIFSSRGQRFFQRIQRTCRNYTLTSVISILSIWLLSKVLALPFSYYTGYYWQKVWGFSTQTPGGWWIDYLKNTGIDLLTFLIGGLLFFWLVNRFQRYWWLVGAILFSLWLVIAHYFLPVIISPLFNDFEPLTDPAIVNMVDDLAQRAGLNIDSVFVMDASRQTTLANAYFSGVGTTKRIVIYDTLLDNYSLPEIKAVIAHEIGHWRNNDIVHGLLYGIIGTFIFFALLRILLKPWLSNNRNKPPQLWAALQLALILLLFVSTPLQNGISREMELRADRFSLELTGDLSGEIQLQKNLASRSLSDLSPPRFIVWFSYSHPPALSRINSLEKVYIETQDSAHSAK
ncbi:M48 family metallopeptidase [Desulfosporosinus youngiae]|uniref:Zn-dependent protease with chaperone function n=1 Tax=Desulfosporosinus youngiae DSM 17734 TaxID=768710 RepID=H5XX24_9FIRM|nr:M48 family metallopeptidase [Desulfosporosinus youngiae]EHQ90892.1 Zn-dependent protease with chaperone function [Desulfosporosinus youngiae DSM 17734]